MMAETRPEDAKAVDDLALAARGEDHGDHAPVTTGKKVAARMQDKKA